MCTFSWSFTFFLQTFVHEYECVWVREIKWDRNVSEFYIRSQIVRSALKCCSHHVVNNVLTTNISCNKDLTRLNLGSVTVFILVALFLSLISLWLLWVRLWWSYRLPAVPSCICTSVFQGGGGSPLYCSSKKYQNSKTFLFYFWDVINAANLASLSLYLATVHSTFTIYFLKMTGKKSRHFFWCDWRLFWLLENQIQSICCQAISVLTGDANDTLSSCFRSNLNFLSQVMFQIYDLFVLKQHTNSEKNIIKSK